MFDTTQWTYITTGHHDGIGFLDNLVVVLQSLLVFNLGNDFNLRPIVVGQQFLEVANIISSTDKGCGNVLDLSSNSKVNDILNTTRRKKKVRIIIWS
jgi:hypothetical protein